jgi:hypothetical protein
MIKNNPRKERLKKPNKVLISNEGDYYQQNIFLKK